MLIGRVNCNMDYVNDCNGNCRVLLSITGIWLDQTCNGSAHVVHNSYKITVCVIVEEDLRSDFYIVFP